MSISYTAILPGSRVRNDTGFIGTVEGLQHAGKDASMQPDTMLVRSEDEQWRFNIPLLHVTEVRQEALHPIVQVDLDADDLPYYIVEDLSPDGQPADGQELLTSVKDDDRLLRVPALAEEIVVRKRPVQIGTVHISKRVQTSKEQRSVPMFSENMVVEHIPPDQYNAEAPTDPNEMIFPVLEEQIVVEKRTVVKEYLRVRRERVERQKVVRGTVRREVVDVTGPQGEDLTDGKTSDTGKAGKTDEAARQDEDVVEV